MDDSRIRMMQHRIRRLHSFDGPGLDEEIGPLGFARRELTESEQACRCDGMCGQVHRAGCARPASKGKRLCWPCWTSWMDAQRRRMRERLEGSK